MAENEVIILIGSNIEPRKNIQRCVELLRKHVEIIKLSSVWKTQAVGSDGPDFLNVAVKISTNYTGAELKDHVLSPIEDQLGRVRTEDKYAPRTIDLDTIIFNSEIKDANLWSRFFIAQPVSELEPDIIHPSSGLSLSAVAQKLKNTANAKPIEDFF